MPQKHLVQVNLREKLNFHDFYFQLRGAGYEDLTMIKSEIFYCIKISKKLSKIICFMQNHELLVFYCGHQSKVHRQKWVSTNRQLIVANLIYITLLCCSVKKDSFSLKKFYPWKIEEKFFLKFDFFKKILYTLVLFDDKYDFRMI